MTETAVVRDQGCGVPHVPSRLLRRAEAADYITSTHNIPCSPKTLAKLATVGGSPPFRKAGRIPLYAPADLDEWVMSKLGPRVSSTSELRKLKAA